MTARRRVSLVLGLTQTLAWGSTYYLPAILAAPMARDLPGRVRPGAVRAVASSASLRPPGGP